MSPGPSKKATRRISHRKPPKASPANTTTDDFPALFERMDTGVALCELVRDENGTITDYRYLEFNPAFETMLRLDHKTARGQRRSQQLPPNENSWAAWYGL